MGTSDIERELLKAMAALDTAQSYRKFARKRVEEVRQLLRFVHNEENLAKERVDNAVQHVADLRSVSGDRSRVHVALTPTSSELNDRNMTWPQDL